MAGQPMKVTVDSNMSIYGVFQPPIDIELQEPENTLRGLLKGLSDLCKSVDFISRGEIGSDIQKVLVNDEESYSLDNALHDGDKVTVVVEMAPLGGG
ncbi:unnamed protein product [marine sediment metagenome]|uniref:Ubiquitin-like domain-containing protein n=1 Tax=marine sediment metagenome TaxID=412755 RepID=X0VB88_9ZZZZ